MLGLSTFPVTKRRNRGSYRTTSTTFLEHRSLVQNSKNYTDDNPLAASSIKTQALIQKRLTDLSLSSEVVWEMVQLKLLGKDIKEALPNGSFALASK